jgi:hypothetical protein
MRPTFTLTNVFKSFLTLSGESAGLCQVTANLSELVSLAAEVNGIGSAGADMSVLAVLESLAIGDSEALANLTLVPPTYYHIILHGQSNATGGNARIFDTDSPPATYMFNGGLRPGGTAGDLVSLTPLLEDNTYSGNKGMSGQSVATSLAKQLYPIFPNPAAAILVVSCVAVNGAAMNAIYKGTTPYTHAMAQVTAANALAIANGSTHRVLGVVFIHGETDDQQGNANYGTQVVQLQADFDTDIKAINGQEEDVPMFACPQAGFYYNNTSTSANATTKQLYDVAVANPTKIVLMNPRYVYNHTDGPHVDVYGNYWQGNRYGKALAKWFTGVLHSPIKVTAMSMEAGNTEVLITFSVPVEPLQWNFQEVLPRPNKGFYFYDDSGSPPEVLDATIEDGNKVRLHLAAASTGGTRRVAYARKLVNPGSEPVPYLGAVGNLTDSESEVSEGGYSLVNWCPPFNLPIT